MCSERLRQRVETWSRHCKLVWMLPITARDAHLDRKCCNIAALVAGGWTQQACLSYNNCIGSTTSAGGLMSTVCGIHTMSKTCTHAYLSSVLTFMCTAGRRNNLWPETVWQTCMKLSNTGLCSSCCTVCPNSVTVNGRHYRNVTFLDTVIVGASIKQIL